MADTIGVIWFHWDQINLQVIAVNARKEGNVSFNDALNTFSLRLYGRKVLGFFFYRRTQHIIYGYIESDIRYRTPQIAREETGCRHYIDYSFRLAARYLLYAPSSDKMVNIHDVCFTSRGTLVGSITSSMGPPRGIDPSTRRNMSGSSTTKLHLAPLW